MLSIGKHPQITTAGQPRRTQISIGDLYQLYAQIARTPGQSARLTWYTLSGDYCISVTDDQKQGVVWQLWRRSNGVNNSMWTQTTVDPAEVHKHIVADVH